MDVQLYVYDLSRGLARQMSMAFLGTQIDAVYHTSLVFDGVEYFFGQGVQTCYPGATHHGQPMEIVSLGKTSLPRDVISEYLESLKEIYTAESYDLFMHNCNNFSHDFATFLVGRGIPEHITSLPQTVLNTPFGQMLRPQLDRTMRAVTQAPVPPQSLVHGQGMSSSAATKTSSTAASNALPKQHTLPSHPHDKLKIPNFSRTSLKPIVYSKVPPLDKLTAKIGDQGTNPIIKDITSFITTLQTSGAKEAPLPDLSAFSKFLLSSITTLAPTSLFAAYDLFRITLTDARVSGFFASEPSTLTSLFEHVLAAPPSAYSLRLVALQAACNLFDSPVFTSTALSAQQDSTSTTSLASTILNLATSSLLDKDHSTLRVAAASLAFNLATQESKSQTQHSPLAETLQVELAAAIIEGLSAADETSTDAIRGLALALARLVYRAPADADVLELCRAMGTADVVKAAASKASAREDVALLNELASELFGKGLTV